MFKLYLFFGLMVAASAAGAQMLHPMSDPDIIFGRVSQVKEIYYLEPQKGEAIDTLEKRIYWYNINGMTDDIQRARKTRTGWDTNPNEFDLRLKKFGDPPITTGRDGADFKIQYDYKGNEIQRDNYALNGSVATSIKYFYDDKFVRTKSELYRNGELAWTVNYYYEQNRLIKERITFPNRTTYDISYKYEGFDDKNNWIKRTRIVANATKDDRPQVTERRVLYYP
ncbi:hypothetical protein [Mucilaginibacter ginkgonis]|uniref:YD repeat-containing protein n=1 Tax=Mucilaginibacter ginkgonis TaxID=2682091 RepID=A0A6I4I0S0_9SPHI|nr:hypothetical protein [Mucilaginibacter ginkgonis]QQL48704.1 hypothetical protein GO620_010990 [Mucilaginibacter ginkgonis]